jgi:excisionase family DNA binding protein
MLRIRISRCYDSRRPERPSNSQVGHVVVFSYVLTVPEAAKRAGRDPETIRRWIRLGKLRARKVGTQHVIEEADLEAMLEDNAEMLPVPERWRRSDSGRPLPNIVAALRRSRRGH